MNIGKAFVERQEQAHPVNTQAGFGNVVGEFGGEGEGQLIDSQAQNHAGVRPAVDDQFALRVLQVALERHHGTPEGDAVMPAIAPLDTSVSQGETDGFTVVGGLAGIQFVAKGAAERVNEFVKG